MHAPGWYPEPQAPAGHLRYWDGQRWTEYRHVIPTPPPSESGQRTRSHGAAGWFARHKGLTALVAIVVLAWGVGQTDSDSSDVEEAAANAEPSVTAPADDESTTAAPDRSEKTKRENDKPARQAEKKQTGTASNGSRGAAPPAAPPKPKPAPKPQRTFLVTRIIDGDTLELGSGESVRLVGIDTPEVGECGFDKAGANLANLVLYERVTLGMSDEDRDAYGRLLRYVNVGNLDAGLRLIQNGLAIARYDSRDGYGYHPREPQYIAADQGSKGLPCPQPKPAPLVSAPNTGGGGACAPGYSPCVPPGPDLDCPDVNGPIRVTGSDPHGLDADGDGVACES